jgi:hypothetical protein
MASKIIKKIDPATMQEKAIGIIIISYDTDVFYNNFYTNNMNSKFMIIDGENKIVYNTDKNKIGTYIRNNTNLTKGQVDQLKELQLATKKVSDKSGLDRINTQFKTINSTAELMGRTGKSALNTLGDDIFKFAQWTISATALMSAINGVRTIVSNVYELDTAMTSLRKVTNETDTAYNKFLDNAAIKSQELATSLATYINQTAEWSKAGFNLIDSAKLAEVSTIFQNVGDVDAATSVADIVTPLKANLCLYI